jgi:GAF domain-containing protein
MQRRGASRQPAKGQRAKRPKGGPKAARKASPAHSSIEPPQEQLVERLRRERDEAIEFQTATGEVLRIVASSPDDLQRVFDAMLEKAISLCAAKFGSLFLYDGKGFTVAVDRNLPPEYAQVVRGQFFTPEANTGFRRLVESQMPLHVTDTFDASYAKGEPLRMAAVELGGVRSLIAVPLLKKGELIGNFSIYKEEPGGFAENQIALVTTFADQAVIAIQNARLFEQTKEALRKLEARSSELAESLQHQTATSQILSVISSSRADIQPVFDAIVNSAARLFEPCGATITTLKDAQLHWDATAATLPDFDIERAKAIYPISFDPERSPSARALLERRIIEIPDISAPDTPEFTRKAAAAGGFRSVTFVPLIKQDKGIGTIILTHQRAGFKLSEKQLALVRTFADQAVIAIENVRLFDEVQAKARDLEESLQQQTATADVLKVISRSTFDLQAVLQTLVESAAKLCEADKATITRQKDGMFFRAETYGFSEEFIKYIRSVPVVPERGSAGGRALLDGVVVHIPDVQADAEYTLAEAPRLGGFRTILSVPMLREGVPIGVIGLSRSEVRPFNDKQIELATTFADQAAIAIENVRLFDEVQAKTRDLSEALVYQTGSGNILSVIASSPTDVGPVLKAIVDSARELCDAYDAVVVLKDGDDLRFSAHRGPIPLKFEKLPINRNWVTGRSVVDKAPIHVHDLLSPEGDQFPLTRKRLQQEGHRTVLSVPMLGEGESIGAIVLRRLEVHPFSDKQIALLQTFANQAVIAIENVRLFDEVQAKTRDLSESLQQQTATAEVLKIISASPGELEPVFQAILEKSVQICDAQFGNLALFDGNEMRIAAMNNAPRAYEELRRGDPVVPLDNSFLAPLVRTQKLVHVSDLSELYAKSSLAKVAGARTAIAVPMLGNDELVGAIAIYHQDVRPFTDKQIELLTNFAAQAVIAIDNARLLNELRRRTDDLTRSLEDLRTAQDRLIQTEKLASLGQLTAGIAHEIKNPLNFVNNFSALSAELIDEMKDVLADIHLDGNKRKELDEITQILKTNLDKVVQHGKRADSIVKNMLQHSRQGSGEHRPVDINAVVDESLNLAYHGARAENTGFNITMHRSFDPAVGMADGYPQEITRALLNLISNGFYAATKRKADASDGFEPTLTATTKNRGDKVEICIRDNGTGIPTEIKEKIFNPFFTTKPAGEGTGLGLSISHDIIVKQHGGTIDVDTAPGVFTEFKIVLPRAGASLIKPGERP